ncbi:MAG: HU family DNA-binding protein [Pseudomonadota bacterium]|nr:HU family DNA-binding protein [Pseudomonadota bacterium]MED5537866.1 HU family DNA-binding protein [Pseudomonadota bacterium]
MTMTKAELIGRMATAANISQDQAKAALEAFTDGVVEALSHGHDVKLIGFGSFTTIERKAGVARNPQTGQAIARAASRTARFRAGEGLKSALNA